MKTFLFFWALNYIAVSAIAFALAIKGSYGCATIIGVILAISISLTSYKGE